MNNATEFIGLISGTLTTIAYIPGVISIWWNKPEPAKGVSTWMYVVLNIGLAGWLTYGLLNWSLPIILSNAITLVLASSILLYKAKYG